MFVRTLADRAAAGMVRTPGTGTRSARYLTAADRMGFSYNDNQIAAGSEMTLWYKHHWEANFILSGRGEVTDLTSGQSWPLEPAFSTSSGRTTTTGSLSRKRRTW